MTPCSRTTRTFLRLHAASTPERILRTTSSLRAIIRVKSMVGSGTMIPKSDGVADPAQQVGAGEQRLGGDAAPVEARATELGALDEHRLRAELRGAQGGDVSRRASAQHHDPGAHESPAVFGSADALRSACCSVRVAAALRARIGEEAMALLTMRSCSMWCEPADPSDGLARRGRPM